VFCLLIYCGPVHGQVTDPASLAKTSGKVAKKRPAPSIETQIREMREELQSQIDDLKAKLAARDAQVETLQTAMQLNQQKTASASAQLETIGSTLQQKISAENGTQASVAELELKSLEFKASVDRIQKTQAAIEKEIDQPISLHYKGITLTPGGFLADESVWRQRALNADIYTDFNLTPYMNSGEAHTSEWVPSARASRPNILVSGKVPFGTINGFLESDFLSAGVTSNNTQTNSYTMRIRQAWAQAVVGRVKLTGGQMWTLATEDKKSADPGQEVWPMIPDGNAHVGFSYLRQVGFRLEDTVLPGLTMAVSLEGSQYQFSASNAPSNFFFGAPGVTQGIENPSANLTNQVAPDVIVKVAVDPGYGHYELGGIGRFFRDRFYPATTTAANAQNDTRFGGGFLANARFPVTPKLDLGVHLIAGDGTGRYGVSLLPDVTVRPNGTLAPLRNAQGLGSIETHPTKRLDFYAYAGTEYVQRTYKVSSTGVLVGYAPPNANDTGCNTEAVPTAATGYAPGTSTCSGATRVLVEGSVGWNYRIYNGPVGKMQFGAAYAYLTREAWTGVGGTPKATNNMVFTSFRYYIP
jgi:hypothetical protein